MSKTKAATAACVAALLSGCQLEAADRVMQTMATAVNRYCDAPESVRLEARERLRPYLRDGVDVTVTCPGQ